MGILVLVGNYGISFGLVWCYEHSKMFYCSKTVVNHFKIVHDLYIIVSNDSKNVPNSSKNVLKFQQLLKLSKLLKISLKISTPNYSRMVANFIKNLPNYVFQTLPN